MISLVKKQVKHIFGEKIAFISQLIISIKGYTLGPASFQFFNTVRKIGCFKICKILIDGDYDFFIPREFLPKFSSLETGKSRTGPNPENRVNEESI